jgi:hypothetical protein
MVENALPGLACLGILLLPALIGLLLPTEEPPLPPRPKQIIELPDGQLARVLDAAELAAYERARREYEA